MSAPKTNEPVTVVQKSHLPGDFSALPLLVRQFVGRLNAAVWWADRLTVSQLFSNVVPVDLDSDGKRALDEYFVLMATSGETSACVGLLGVINGLLEAAGCGQYRIYRQVYEGTDIIQYFGVFELADAP